MIYASIVNLPSTGRSNICVCSSDTGEGYGEDEVDDDGEFV